MKKGHLAQKKVMNMYLSIVLLLVVMNFVSCLCVKKYTKVILYSDF